MIRLSFQGIQHRRAQPKVEELSPSRSAVNHVPGLFCNGSAKYAQRALPWRGAIGLPIIFLRKITALRYPSGGRHPSSLRLAAPAFAKRRSACRYMPRMA